MSKWTIGRRGAVLGLTALASARGAAAQAPAVVEEPIVVPGARLEKVFGEGFFLEGPAQGPDGAIYFSDITQTWRTGMAAGHIWRHDPRTGETRIFRSPSGMANGIRFDAQGRMVVAHGADFGSRIVTRTDLASGRATILAGLYGARPFNAPNDLDIDAAGRIWFTDPRYFGHEPVEQPAMGVYRIDPDGSVQLVLADVSRPNGIAVSPDGRALYVAEADFLLADRRIPASVPWRNRDMHILRYDLSPEGTPGNRRVLVDFDGEGGGGADGIRLDRDGNIYAAVQTARFGVRVYTSEGREIAFVPTPEKPTNVELAVVDGRTWLYIAAIAGGGLYRIETQIPPLRHGR
ncbi:SMP-30/gluconolactonase/LRE family protein [Roseomonas populi]|uniref:SMP-30/gluconolactonase/LRE family protein n=1 Tax=Roseomonas populi TaxID=3121582 RepID=A0ABT1XF41_9PROT|nr:SMP-30/gluconolactonase/LRE family protein [Roseomonas pecuniae]MCR0985594.1 SMP-30/gluconolactonase/LRE family protein [Roseomonas pecuniae]